MYKKPNIIAEIGCNHKGSIDIAYELIKLAKKCNADVVKFQKRNPKELLTDKQYNAPHPNIQHSYGNTYGEHRENLEFDYSQHYDIKQYCESIGIEYSTSVWDVSSTKEIVKLNPNLIKIPSACNNNYGILSLLLDEYEGDIHISLGMTKNIEKEKLIDYINNSGHLNRVVFYICTSGYPVSFDDLCLLEIKKLITQLNGEAKGVGFSGHHLGIAADIAAYTLGAHWIERHFTKNRTWKGTDHAASLEPSGFSKLIRDLNATKCALQYKPKDILDIEIPQYEKLKWKK